MNLNKKELKKVIYDFNSTSNRLMKVDFQEYLSVLKKFLRYIEECPIILNYIQDSGQPTFDIAEEVASVARSYGREYFDLGETTQAEISNVYNLLKYIAENNIQIHHGLAMAYSIGSNKYQDNVKGFNERVTLVLIRHIEGYLTKIGIDMGVDETVKYDITVNNGQVNVANDNATIHATSNHYGQQIELDKLVSAIKNADLSMFNEEEQQTLLDNVEIVQEQLGSNEPKKGFIRTAMAGISGLIYKAATLTEPLQKLIEFAKPYIE